MDSPPFTAIDHVQLAMPAGGEAMARAFYVEVLGMIEVDKPPQLASNGGCWFRSGDINIHLGVDSTEFKPARKAHPALVCADFDTLMARMQDEGVKIRFEERDGRRKAFVDDAFGNRIELLEALA